MNLHSGISAKELRPAVFLDRDGTIIDEVGYLDDPAGVFFYPGVTDALKRLKDRGYLLIVLTNQSGIGRGFFDEETAVTVNYSVVRMLGEEGVVLDAIYFCPHHPDEGCGCRKPGQLMVRRAMGDFGIDPGLSWMVGDMGKDVLMALEAGLRPVLVETGNVEKGDVPANTIRSSAFLDAVKVILDEGVS